MAELRSQFDANDKTDDEFARLAVCHLEGTLSTDDAERLRSMLADAPARRKEFVAFCLHARLIASRLGPEMAAGLEDATPAVGEQASETLAEQAPTTESATTEPTASQPAPLLGFLGEYFEQGRGFFSNNTPFALLVSAAVMGTLLTLLAIWAAPSFRGWVERNRAMPTQRIDIVGRVAEAVDVRWATGQRPRKPGEALTQGDTIQLAAGLLKIEFDKGAQVVIEGPATFVLHDQNAGRLQAGQLAAQVHRDAVGFRVETPSATITDLGTEFGLSVGPRGATQVCVTQGTVEVQVAGQSSLAAAARSQVLVEGQIARIAEGKVKKLSAEHFVRARRRVARFRQLAPLAITTADGRGADTYVRAGKYAEDNFGSDPDLCVKMAGGIDYTRRTLLRFDLAEIKKTIASSYLELTLVDVKAAPDSMLLVFALPEDDWTEEITTWQSLPFLRRPDPNRIPDDLPLLGKLVVRSHPGRSPRVYLKDARLAQYLNEARGKTVSLMLVAETPEVPLSFSSRENSLRDAPTLYLNLDGDHCENLPERPEATSPDVLNNDISQNEGDPQ